jgi:lipoate---protein ligase
MQLIRNTRKNPVENLAFDEAMIEWADTRSEIGLPSEELLRLWEMPTPCVVLGRASKWDIEVNHANCERQGIPVFRRMSGGATVVAGPGCLMYSLLLSYESRPALRMLDVAHSQVMQRVRDASQETLKAFDVPGVIELQGTCDLTLANRKFSGNALRCKRNWMLYHGTILISMPLEWLGQYLLEPPRQPDYREKRNHLDFVTTLLPANSKCSPIEFRQVLEQQIAIQWGAHNVEGEPSFIDEIEALEEQLMETRYGKDPWHRGS